MGHLHFFQLVDWHQSMEEALTRGNEQIRIQKTQDLDPENPQP
jgi:hypothetical protein